MRAAEQHREQRARAEAFNQLHKFQVMPLVPNDVNLTRVYAPLPEVRKHFACLLHLLAFASF